MSLVNQLIILISIIIIGCRHRVLRFSNEESINISGKVIQQDTYCGGARPTIEALKKVQEQRPFPNKVFFIRKGEVNKKDGKIIKSFKSDLAGNFTFKLPPGVYSILLEEQVNEINVKDYQKENQKVDELCLEKWWETPFYVLNVSKITNESLSFSFINRCFLNTTIPCVTYSGAFPH